MSEANAEGRSTVPPEERRKYARMRREVNVTCRPLSAPGDHVEARSQDLGVGGLLLSHREPLAVGAMLLLRAEVQREGLLFSAYGRVVWTEPSTTGDLHESGICFAGLDAVQRENVLSVIARREQPGEERRYYIRLEKRLTAEYRPPQRFPDQWRPAQTENISMGGALLLLEEKLTPHEAVFVRIHLDDTPSTAVEAEGVTVAPRPSEQSGSGQTTGVRFLTMKPESRDRLSSYLSRLLTARVMGYD